jgi:glyoxylase-like metal-dependent hydrolase (beta-lactamase superfamily II)
MNITNLAENTEDFTGNVWLISGEQNILVDTGKGDCWENIQDLESIDIVVVTHSHYDHVDNLPKVLDMFDPEIYAYEPENLPVNSQKLEEGDLIELSGSEFEILHTPGHKDDSICLYSAENKILFAGDLLFPKGSFGRTDLEEGDRDLLIDSIEKIVNLDVEKMYCGHDAAATQRVNQQIQNSLENARKKEPKY